MAPHSSLQWRVDFDPTIVEPTFLTYFLSRVPILILAHKKLSFILIDLSKFKKKKNSVFLLLSPSETHNPSQPHSVQLAPYFKVLLLNKVFLTGLPLISQYIIFWECLPTLYFETKVPSKFLCPLRQFLICRPY